ncbi:hypothetical protein D3C79_965260 [compost metagenome]
MHLEGCHGDQLVRIRIVFHRLYADHFAVLHYGFESAPVRAGQNAFLRLAQYHKLRQCLADGLRQRRFRPQARQQRCGGQRGGAGQEAAAAHC